MPPWYAKYTDSIPQPPSSSSELDTPSSLPLPRSLEVAGVKPDNNFEALVPDASQMSQMHPSGPALHDFERRRI